MSCCLKPQVKMGGPFATLEEKSQRVKDILLKKARGWGWGLHGCPSPGPRRVRGHSTWGPEDGV